MAQTSPRTIILFAWAGWIFDFFDLILYSFLLIGIQDEFLLSDTEVAVIYSASLAITAVGGIVLGVIGDKYGRKPAILFSVLIFSIGTFFSGLAWGLSSLLFFRIITGFGIGGEWAAGHTLVNETLPSGKRGQASAFIQSGAPVGAALASVIGGFVTPIIGWRFSFILASIPSLLLVMLMHFYLPESPQFLIFKAEANEHEEFRGIHYVREATKRSARHLWSVRRPLFLGTILSLFGMLAYWVIFSWVPKYLKLINFSDASIGWWMLCAQLGAFIGYLSFGYVADWSGKFRTTFGGYTLVFALGVQIFIRGNELSNYYLSLFGMFLTGLGTGFFSGYGPLYCKLFPTRIRNTSASWCFNMGRLGSFIAPIMVAEIASGIGYGWALSLASIFAISACCWVFLITRDDMSGIHYEYESNPPVISISQN